MFLHSFEKKLTELFQLTFPTSEQHYFNSYMDIFLFELYIYSAEYVPELYNVRFCQKPYMNQEYEFMQLFLLGMSVRYLVSAYVEFNDIYVS